MNNGFHIGTVSGIPIKLHSSLIIALPFVALTFFGEFPFPLAVFTTIFLFACIALHELGHSLVGLACGYRIREIMLMPIGGVAKIERMSNKARDEFLVAAAGPAVSLIIGFSLLIPYFIFGVLGWHSVASYFLIIAVINIVLALFNLAPAFPMDGGRILRSALTPLMGRLKATWVASKIGQVLAVAFFIYSLFWLQNGFLGTLLHSVIAYVIYKAAEREYRMVLMQESVNRMNPFQSPFGYGPPPTQDDGIQVGPAPYEEQASPIERLKNWFNRTF